MGKLYQTMKKVFQFSSPLAYKLLYVYVYIAHRLYYPRFTVIGFEKIPTGAPVIFAPNHQNALMDALAVGFAARRQLFFMAGAVKFKKPDITSMLRFLRVFTLYRMRDGIGLLSLNQEVFDKAANVLKSNTPICIFPEGSQEGRKRLRQLKKGIFRIAFQAAESHPGILNLHIVPVGIDYSEYFHSGSELMVVFGTPVKVADYIDQYIENEPKAINALRRNLEENMRNVMIHIPEENYNLVFQICEMLEPIVYNSGNLKPSPQNKLNTRQYIIQKTVEAFNTQPQKAVEIGEAIQLYTANLSSSGLTDQFLVNKPENILILLTKTMLSVMLFPLHMYGVLMNYLPYKLTQRATKKTNDRHFKSSIQFAVSTLMFPIYYLVILATFFTFADGLLVNLLFLFSLPVSGLFALYNHKHMKYLYRKIKFLIFRLVKSGSYSALVKEREQLMELLKTTIVNP